MQDRYAGDIGDFVKLGLLRAISPGRRLGIVWYRFPDECHNNDGRHVSYLDQPDRYSSMDPKLFEHLNNVVRDARSINSLMPALGEAKFFDQSLDLVSVPASQRRDWRRAWFDRARNTLSDCDLVFADPDNGIVDDSDWRKGRANFGKQIPLEGVKALACGRCAVIYHHNTRRKGGHDAEVDHWLSEIGMPGMAVRSTAYSPRTFMVVNPDIEVQKRVVAFCERWESLRVRLHTAK